MSPASPAPVPAPVPAAAPAAAAPAAPSDTTRPSGAAPALFISHGSPMIALEPGATGAFLTRLGPALDAEFGRPRAILAVSAHTAAREPVLLAGARHEAVADFGGFPAALHRLRYDAPGAPSWAQPVAQRLGGAGFALHVLDRGGLDHGIWTVLRYLYPAADVPVLPLALVPDLTPERQLALGAALAPLAAQGLLILGTGSITHNLRRLVRDPAPSTGPGMASASGASGTSGGPEELPESAAFRRWIHERATAADRAALVDYRARAPHAVEMHPTDEHLLPWFVAAGAGGFDAPVQRLHEGHTHGSLGMDAYAFGAGASRLAARLARESADRA